MKNIIFGYYYSLAMSFTDRISVEVFEKDGEYFAECTMRLKISENKETKKQLSKDTIDKIIQIYNDNRQVFDIEKVEFPPVLDGSSNRFVFSDGELTNDVFASNIWYYKTEPSDNAKLILKVFEKIKTLLLSEGIDKSFFKL